MLQNGQVDVNTLVSVLTLLGLLGAAIAYLRARRLESSLEAFTKANDELRQEVEYHERRRAADQKQCERDLAKMAGRLDAMTEQFAESIARAVVAALKS